MKENKETLTFWGAILKGEESFAPDENGIYAAFACIAVNKDGKLKWHPERTLYIGKAEGKDTIKKRISVMLMTVTNLILENRLFGKRII